MTILDMCVVYRLTFPLCLCECLVSVFVFCFNSKTKLGELEALFACRSVFVSVCVCEIDKDKQWTEILS